LGDVRLMGWTFTHRERGATSNLAWFKRDFDHPPDRELLDLAQVGFTLYGAYRVAERVVGLVILTRWVKTKDDGSWDGDYNYGWKEMDESCGPGYYDCPPRIFDLLTPHDGSENEWARDWRAKCRESIAKAKARPRLTEGTKVRFAQPLRFTDGSTNDTFEFIKRTTFRQLHRLDFTPQIGDEFYRGGRVRISGWNKREYAVL
jgi:hypothetical protein